VIVELYDILQTLLPFNFYDKAEFYEYLPNFGVEIPESTGYNKVQKIDTKKIRRGTHPDCTRVAQMERSQG